MADIEVVIEGGKQTQDVVSTVVADVEGVVIEAAQGVGKVHVRV